MQQSYRDPTDLDQGQQVVWRPMPAPITSYRPAIPEFLINPKFWTICAASFTAFGLAGGLWLGAKLTEARVAAAEQQAQQAQQARQEAETRLAAQVDATAKFCQAALSGQPATQLAANPATQQPTGTVAASINPAP